MRRRPTLLLILLALAAALPRLSGQLDEVRRYDAEAQSRVRFTITESKLPAFPLGLRRQGVNEGTATYAISVNPFGELDDYLLLETTHRSFADAVEAALPEWRFATPAIDGETAAIVSTLKVTFERGGGVVYESTGFDLRSVFQQYEEKEIAYRVRGIWELDRIPEPLKVEKPEFHVDLLEAREQVNAVFEFYIDDQGKVRMPTLREADNQVDERLLIIAQEALLQWRFEPPTVNGRPVVTKAAQPFSFIKKDGVGVAR